MGCFDFHYADRFINMNRRGGYYVVPRYLKEDLGLKEDYIRFKSSDDYGRLFLEKGESGVYFDIYNLYSIQLLSYFKEDLGISSKLIQKLYDKLYQDDDSIDKFDIRGLGISFNCKKDFVLSSVNMTFQESFYEEANYVLNLATFEKSPLIITMFKPKFKFEDFEYVTRSGQYYGRKLKCKWIKDDSIYKDLMPTELKVYDFDKFKSKLENIHMNVDDEELKSKKINKLMNERLEIDEYNNNFINVKAYKDLKNYKQSLKIYSNKIIEEFNEK